MPIPENKNTICWYCAKACDCTQCTISKGIKPKCAIKTNGNVIECTNFVRDIPKPITNEEFEKCFNISISKVRYYRHTMFRCKELNSYKNKILKAIQNENFTLDCIKVIKQKKYTLLHKLSVCMVYKKYTDPLNYNKTHYYKYYSAINKPFGLFVKSLCEYVQKAEYSNYLSSDKLLKLKKELSKL